MKSYRACGARRFATTLRRTDVEGEINEEQMVRWGRLLRVSRSHIGLPGTLTCLEWYMETGPSKNSYKGPVITISISTDGEYHWSNGSSRFTFRCDGKYRPVGKNRTEACVKRSATALDLLRKKSGAETNTYHWDLSDGGNVLTVTATAFRASGPIIFGHNVALRMSASKGFAGQWRDAGYLQHHADLTLRLDSQTLHIGYPDAGQYIDAPLDGVDVPVRGPHAPEGVTYAVLPSGQREFLILAKHDGKVLDQDSLELSNDGKTITESWWNPSQPTDKGTLVYVKQ